VARVIQLGICVIICSIEKQYIVYLHLQRLCMGYQGQLEGGGR